MPSSATLLTAVLALPSLADDLQRIAGVYPTALWLPERSDGIITLSPPRLTSRVWTASATLQGRMTQQGRGVLVAMNGMSDRLTTPDTTDMSPGNGTVDQALSVVSVVNVTDTSGTRAIFTKASGVGAFEYGFGVSTGDRLFLDLFDQSVGGLGSNPERIANVGVTTMGALRSFGVTYDPAIGSGATAADGIVLYQGGEVLPSAARNQATYVAMENTAAPPAIGDTPSFNQWFSGSMGFVAAWVGTALTAAQHQQATVVANRYYGLTL